MPQVFHGFRRVVAILIARRPRGRPPEVEQCMGPTWDRPVCGCAEQGEPACTFSSGWLSPLGCDEHATLTASWRLSGGTA